MDWSGCEFVEVVPGKVSGVPLIKGTSISADSVLVELTSGSTLEQISEEYPAVAKETLRSILTYGVERLGWDTETLVDWRGCPLVEKVPGRCSGAPTIVGTRIFPDTIAEYYWSGAAIDEIRDDFPSLSKEKITGLIDYVKSRELSVA
jgi:uncharacterized protein (DUF433 family)